MQAYLFSETLKAKRKKRCWCFSADRWQLEVKKFLYGVVFSYQYASMWGRVAYGVGA